MPVGVRTIELGGHLAEVWYPAAEPGPGEDVDFAAAAPDVVLQATGPLDVPLLPTVAVRDAEPRALAEPQPLVVFSHGFGGTRLQSVTLTTHWAGRGYVVVATDHAGRSLPDLLPCLFSPPLEGCALSFDDPGPADVSELLDALEAPPDWLAPLLDLERVAVTGHSAGGGTTVTVGADDDRVDALVPMAGGDATGGLPTLRLAGHLRRHRARRRLRRRARGLPRRRRVPRGPGRRAPRVQRPVHPRARADRRRGVRAARRRQRRVSSPSSARSAPTGAPGAWPPRACATARRSCRSSAPTSSSAA
jgi:alpha-beta hydrolase superfamily lysophospholipase